MKFEAPGLRWPQGGDMWRTSGGENAEKAGLVWAIGTRCTDDIGKVAFKGPVLCGKPSTCLRIRPDDMFDLFVASVSSALLADD